MSRTDDANSTSLPLWIAVGCLVGGVLLFFGNTVPALREGDDLSRIDDDLDDLKHRHTLAIEQARLAGAGHDGAAIDLQSLFVAIDQKGFTISEFCAAYPVEDEEEGDSGQR